MKLKSIIRIMVFVLCVLFSFQARAGWFTEHICCEPSSIGYSLTHQGLDLTDSVSDNQESADTRSRTTAPPAVIMDYTVYVDGAAEGSNSVTSDDAATTDELTINMGQFFHVKASCRLDAEDTADADVDHADDFTFEWRETSGIAQATWEVKDTGEEETSAFDNVLNAYAMVVTPVDRHDDFYDSLGNDQSYHMEVRCTYEDYTINKQIKFEIHESELVVEATPATVEIEVGEAVTVSVTFSGDLDACPVQPSFTFNPNSVDNPASVDIVDCSEVLSDNGSSLTGLAVEQGSVIATGLIGKVYQASYRVTGSAVGTYNLGFTVKGNGYWGQTATDSVTVTVTEPLVTETLTDADGDGSFTPEDCNDGNAAINPEATEVCDSVDNDCDGSINEGFTTATYHLDADGDGYGTSSVHVSACAQPSHYVTNDDDCNDTKATINPNAEELCDGVDNNCDGVIDGADCTAVVDADGDGFLSSVDCDDTNANINTAASDDCTNQIDMNCDGAVTNCSTTPPPSGVEPLIVVSQGSGEATGGASGCSLGGVGVPANAGFLFFLFGVGFFRLLMKRV